MITQFTDYYQNSAMAQASYQTLTKNGDFDRLKAELQENNKFSDSQATQFAEEYTVLDQYEQTRFGFSLGFSATVFKDSKGQITLATRGTEPSDISDLAEDLAVIGKEGIAVYQTLELYNYLLRLQAHDKEAVPQYSINPFKNLLSKSLYDNIDVSYITATKTGALVGQSNINITGHSLGGQLAMSASRLIPNLTQSVYTYNAVGFDTFVSDANTDLFFDTLAQHEVIETSQIKIANQFNSNKLNHIVIEQDLVSDIGQVYGEQIPVFSETSNIDVVSSHFINGVTDVLAVYDLYSLLNTSLSNDIMTSILKASSAQANNSAEASVNQLAQILGVSIEVVQAGDGDSFYSAIKSIKDNSLYQQLQQSSIDFELLTGNASTLESQAKTDDAVLYSLLTLTPFIMTGGEADTVYQQFSEQYELFDAGVDDGGITDDYLKDRANMFEVMMSANEQDAAYNNTGKHGSFTDIESGIQLLIREDNNSALDLTQNPQIIFGDANSNVITGGDKDDHLYGGKGSDTLNGDDGKDVLQAIHKATLNYSSNASMSQQSCF